MKRILLNIIVVIVLSAITGCVGATKYEVLTFFFDGVPSPDTSAHIDSVSTAKMVSTQNDSSDDIVKEVSATSTHRPYAEKKCSVCHDANSMSEAKTQILQRCQNCHPKFKEQYNYVHGPVAVFDCTSCHAPHQSDNAGLLKRAGDFLCTYCHKNAGQSKIDQHSQIGIVKCLACHTPHFSNDNRFFVITGKSGP